jgi:diguanylate cyclase (GGDEF)-like protein/PAS domain S-box-containing protein
LTAPIRIVPWLQHLLRVLLLPSFALALLAAMWIAVALQVAQEQQTARHEAVGRSQALARVLSEHVSHILRQTDHATQLFKLTYEMTGGRLRLPEFMRPNGLLDSVLPSRLALPVALIDSAGNIVDSANGYPGANLARHPTFLALARNNADAPLFSTPVIDQNTRQWQIQVARRLNGANGQFAGMIVILIDPAFFVDDYDRLNVDEEGALALMSRDAGLSTGRMGERMFISDKLDFAPVPNAAGREEIQARGPIDNIARIYGASDMPRYSLVAVVGMTEREAMAVFERHRTTYVAISIAATILIVAIFAVLMKQSARLRASIREARQAQATLRAAADGSLDAFIVLKAWSSSGRQIDDFIITDINHHASAMLGMPATQLIGQRAFALLPRYRQTGFFALYVKVMDSGEPLEEEVELRLDNDPPSWLHHQIVPIEGGVAVTSRNITARKKEELETRSNRSFLQSLINNLPLLIYVKSLCPNTMGTMMVWNDAAEAVSGYPAARVVGKRDVDVFPEGFGLCDPEEDRAMLASPTVVDLPEKQITLADGSVRYLHQMSVPLFDDAGKVEYILCIAEDVTRRREQENSLRASEMALRESEARLRTIADTLPAMIAYIDANQVYRFNNRAYDREFGHKDQCMLGKTILETVGAKRYAFLLPYIERVLSGETLVFEEHDETEGMDRALEATYIPQLGEDGAGVVGFHVMRHDITSQKREKKRLLKLSQVDALTGLANRAGFLQKLDEAMRSSAGDDHQMAVMYMDIDHFKPVNDTYGHNVGDALLKAFAGRLTHALRASDTIARLGGDEFTIIMEQIARPEIAEVIAAKIVAAMRAPFELDGVTVSISASIGLAYFRNGPLDPDALLKQADMMLYQAKQAGRDTWRAAA